MRIVAPLLLVTGIFVGLGTLLLGDQLLNQYLVTTPTEPGTDEERFIAQTTKAAKLGDELAGNPGEKRGDELNAKLRETVQPIATLFAEVSVTTPDQKPKWGMSTLNGKQTGFDAIRFRTPKAGTRFDLQWSFVRDVNGPNFKFWYIMPASGTMEGFKRYNSKEDVTIEGVDLPEQNLMITQPLGGAELKPETDYLIYFHIGHSASLKLWHQITVIPAEI